MNVFYRIYKEFCLNPFANTFYSTNPIGQRSQSTAKVCQVGKLLFDMFPLRHKSFAEFGLQQVHGPQSIGIMGTMPQTCAWSFAWSNQLMIVLPGE